MTLRSEAKRQGRPAPSDSIVALPGLGTAEAKQLGYARVGEQAMKGLRNGWEQASAAAGGWQRCRLGEVGPPRHRRCIHEDDGAR